MGGSLDKPITNKHFECFGNEYFRGCAGFMHGKRMTNEDAHLIHLCQQNDCASLFGVFDGHGGSKAAEYIKLNLKSTLLDGLTSIDEDDEIKKRILKLDERYMEDIDEEDGSTCVFALIEKRDPQKSENLFRIKVGNVGDSRCIMYKEGKCLPLTEDHKPINENEKNRIIEAGGNVYMNRVNGSIALSRAIGDKSYKSNSNLDQTKQMIIALPDLKLEEGKPGDFIVIACDGLFESDVFTNESLVEFIKKGIENKEDLEVILGKALDICVEKSNDNMSIMVIELGVNGSEYNNKGKIFVPTQPYDCHMKQYEDDVKKGGWTLLEALEKVKVDIENELENKEKSTQQKKELQNNLDFVKKRIDDCKNPESKKEKSYQKEEEEDEDEN